MKVSAQQCFRSGIFLFFLLLSNQLKAQISAYPLGPNASNAPSRPSFPGVAPGISSQGPGLPKDLSNRFGLGVTNLGPKQSPQLSVDWQTSRSASVEFNLGFDSLADNNEILISGRFSRNMFIEENLHFFLYLGGGLSSGQSSGKSQSGMTAEAGAGLRFFFAGLPNLGWHLRYGLFYKTAGSSRMLTTGVSGVHYYF